jgi:hypothetical protein
MISRLTATAALFAILGAATLAFATETQQRHGSAGPEVSTTAPAEIILLPRVEGTGHRSR